MTSATFELGSTAPGARRCAATPTASCTITLPPLSVAVYKALGTIPKSPQAPSVAIVAPAHNGAGERPDRAPRRCRRRLQLRGHVLGEGRRRPVGADRHRRQRALPRVPRRLRPAARDGRAIPGGRARQRRALGVEQRPPGAGRQAVDRVGRARRGRQGPRRDDPARDPGPRARQLRRDVPAPHRRRIVDRRRRRLLLAGLQRHRHATGAAERDRGRLPRGARLRRRDDHERGAQRRRRRRRRSPRR